MSKLQQYEEKIELHVNAILNLNLKDLDEFNEAFDELQEVILDAGDDDMFDEGFGIGDTIIDAFIKITTSDTFYLRSKETPEVWSIMDPIIECMSILASNVELSDAFSIDKLKVYLITLLAYIKSEPNVHALESVLTLFFAIVRGEPEKFKHEVLLFSLYIADHFEESVDLRFFTMMIIGVIGSSLTYTDLSYIDIDFATTIELVLKYIVNKGYDDEETNYWYAIKFIGDILRILCEISAKGYIITTSEDDPQITPAFIHALIARFLTILTEEELQFQPILLKALDDEIKTTHANEAENESAVDTRGHQLLLLATDRYTEFLSNAKELNISTVTPVNPSSTATDTINTISHE